jgi:hypothetical protein
LELKKEVERELVQQVEEARHEEQVKAQDKSTTLETHIQRLDQKVEFLTNQLINSRGNASQVATATV